MCIKLIPQLFAVKHQERCVRVAGDTQVFLYLIELGGFNGDKRIFLTINSFCLKGCKNLSKIHRNCVGTQRLERVQEDVVLHDANFDAFKVFRFCHRTLVIG